MIYMGWCSAMPVVPMENSLDWAYSNPIQTRGRDLSNHVEDIDPLYYETKDGLGLDTSFEREPTQLLYSN